MISIRTKQLPDPIPFPPEHEHTSNATFPVICCDLNLTLTPALEYPLTKGPFPKVKKWLQKWVDMGACVHVTSSGLYLGRQDIPVFLARQRMVNAWALKYDLPLGYVGGKVPADVYLADNMVNVPLVETPDWDVIGNEAEEILALNWDVKDGEFVSNDRPSIGTPITDFPSSTDLKPDEPRGYSTARINVDMHRTLFASSSSTLQGPPLPGAVEAVNSLYDAGLTVRVDCAGWSPLTHPAMESGERYNGLRWQLQKAGIRYDRVVTKDYGQVYIDDKGIKFTTWKDCMPTVIDVLSKGKSKEPAIQWPA